VNTFVDALTAILLVGGTWFTAVACIGLFRMPDAYARIHVATKPATLGVLATCTAAMLQAPFGGPTGRLALAVAFQLWSVPAASHMLGRAARRSGLRPATPDAIDESPAD
jgi:multicomponent Na+:H+ antiporter subunit G